MEKLQKQLVDTYLRKRVIANDFDYTNILEVEYLLNNNYNIKLKYFTFNNIINLLRRHPEFITRLDGEDIKKLNDIEYFNAIFYEFPKENIDYILKNINYKYLSNSIIKDIILGHPEAINYIDVDKLTGNYISTILSYYPEFIKYFDLSKLANYNIRNLLVLQPQLKKYFTIEY